MACGTGVWDGWVPGWGMGTGWVLGRAIPGTQPAAKRRQIPAKRAPEPPAGGWSGWVSAAAPRSPGDHPCGARSVLWPSLSPPRANPASGPIRRDSTTFPIKLVKTVKCRQNMSKRPVIVPNSQNGSQMSPLDILRFPFAPAFSHKELMGRFDATLDFIVKTTKCRRDVHTGIWSRRGRSIPPVVPQQAAPGTTSSLTSARAIWRYSQLTSIY